MRWAVGLEYDGSSYHGWQIQSDFSIKTLQLSVEQALSKIANHPVGVICAGRTDRGVHATSQVIHFDTHQIRQPNIWLSGLNHFLPHDMRGLWIKEVSENFHARFSALSRSYRYIIYNHPVRPALWRNRVTWIPYFLREQKMAEAANFLLGEHDFSAFRGADCQAKTAIRRIDKISIQRCDDHIILQIEANAFLHHMVRNIVGVLLEIGVAKRLPEWAHEVLIGKNRRLAGVTAAPYGLYLEKVTYPPEFNLPKELPKFLCYP